MAYAYHQARSQHRLDNLSTRKNAHDDGGETRVGVIRDRVEQRVLVHVRCGEERAWYTTTMICTPPRASPISTEFIYADARARLGSP